jgi:diguanylate cyclase (GGDEF)-like protein
MEFHPMMSLAAISMFMLGLALVIISGRLASTRLIRQMGMVVLVVSAGMFLRATAPREAYGATLIISTLTYLFFSGWALSTARTQTGAAFHAVQVIVFAAISLVLVLWGVINYSNAYRAIGLAYLLIAAAYISCIPRGFTKGTRKQFIAISLMLLSCVIGALLHVSLAITFFTHDASAVTQISDSQLVLSSFAMFWLAMLGAFGLVMYVLGTLNADIENKAMLDPLTLTLNRRGLDRYIARWVAKEAIHHLEPRIGVVTLDIDNFKLINDQFGHINGDAVLVECAKRLRSALRTKDALCRTGGEEFCALLDQANHATTQEICDRLCAVIKDTPFVVANTHSHNITISVGYTVANGTQQAINNAMDDVDRALYAAKRLGKNCVVSVESLPAR